MELYEINDGVTLLVFLNPNLANSAPNNGILTP